MECWPSLTEIFQNFLYFWGKLLKPIWIWCFQFRNRFIKLSLEWQRRWWRRMWRSREKRWFCSLQNSWSRIEGMATLLSTFLPDLNVWMTMYWWIWNGTNWDELELDFIIGWFGNVCGPRSLSCWWTSQLAILNSWSIKNLQKIVGWSVV